MKIYPAIDLLGGKVVRLQQGRFDATTTYHDDPLKIALNFARQGASYLHIVDLDGARQGQPMQFSLLQSLARAVPLKIQIGGGIRSSAQVAQLLACGIERVVIGSLAVQDPAQTRQLLEEFGGERITLGLDVRLTAAGEPMVATHGWQSQSTVSAHEILDSYLSLGLQQVVCTDISRDGMLSGPNFTLYKSLRERYPQLSLLASGGMHTLDDIRQLRTLDMGGAILGKALYEGTIALEEALSC